MASNAKKRTPSAGMSRLRLDRNLPARFSLSKSTLVWLDAVAGLNPAQLARAPMSPVKAGMLTVPGTLKKTFCAESVISWL